MYGEIDKFIDEQGSEWVDTNAGMYSIPHEDGKKLHCYKVNADVVTGDGKNGRAAVTIASAFMALGGKCSCCGEEDWNTLEIDHINGDGAKERKSRSKEAIAKTSMLAGIIKNGAQGRYQLLCGNCHNRKTAKQRGYDKNLNKPI
jgi:hypothetical protein